MQSSGAALTSITTDGDVKIAGVVEKLHGRDVVLNRDPNHYAKGLLKDVQNLATQFSILADVATVLKIHFLVGTLSSTNSCTPHTPLLTHYCFFFLE